MAFDQLKMLKEAKKIQSELKKQVVEVEAGDGAVVIEISGEMKVKSLKLDADKIDMDDLPELERWIVSAFNEGYAKMQQIVTEKTRPLMGGLSAMMGGK
jgi:hypothetical protein